PARRPHRDDGLVRRALDRLRPTRLIRHVAERTSVPPILAPMAGSSARVATSSEQAAPTDDLNERLAALTLRDEHRLRRRVERVRRGHDELGKLLAEIARGESTVQRRR